MPFLPLQNDYNKSVDLHYQDYGSGRPVILIHGWPLSHRMWERQILDLVEAGYRVIAYDRRGFGLSDFPWDDFDYDTLTDDLRNLIVELDLRDVTLVGFSMGGGEVVRYATKYGDDRISQNVLLSSIIPLVAQKDDNPDGVPQQALNELMSNLKQDRMKFLKGFTRNFVNYEENKDKVSEEMLHFDWTVAAYASNRATIETAKSWAETDFRAELKNISVPTMIIHGTADNIVPIKSTGDQAAKIISDATYHKLEGAPHGCVYTHAETVNRHLIDFLNTCKSNDRYGATSTMTSNN